MFSKKPVVRWDWACSGTTSWVLCLSPHMRPGVVFLKKHAFSEKTSSLISSKKPTRPHPSPAPPKFPLPPRAQVAPSLQDTAADADNDGPWKVIGNGKRRTKSQPAKAGQASQTRSRSVTSQHNVHADQATSAKAKGKTKSPGQHDQHPGWFWNT